MELASAREKEGVAGRAISPPRFSGVSFRGIAVGIARSFCMEWKGLRRTELSKTNARGSNYHSSRDIIGCYRKFREIFTWSSRFVNPSLPFAHEWPIVFSVRPLYASEVIVLICGLVNQLRRVSCESSRGPS